MNRWVVLLAVLAMFFGFPPSGAVAVVMALAAGAQDRTASDAELLRARAVRWSLTSLVIGGVVEIPVVVALATGAWSG